MGAPATRGEWPCYSRTSLQSEVDVRDWSDASRTGEGEGCYLDVFRGALDAQESALQNIKRAETLCEYVLKLLARPKVRECEGLVLSADGSRRFTLVAKTKNVRFYEPSREARIVYLRVDLYGNVIYLC
jgi:hypothetical protein